jgi:hypothetical protein
MLSGKRKGPKWLWWAIHNVIAHPLSEIFYWIRLESVGNWLHDETVPLHEKGSGRG